MGTAKPPVPPPASTTSTGPVSRCGAVAASARAADSTSQTTAVRAAEPGPPDAETTGLLLAGPQRPDRWPSLVTSVGRRDRLQRADHDVQPAAVVVAPV